MKQITSLTESTNLRQMEMRLQQAENRARLSEERSDKNEQLLNQKLMEMTKLQGTLTQQTKVKHLYFLVIFNCQIFCSGYACTVKPVNPLLGRPQVWMTHA